MQMIHRCNVCTTFRTSKRTFLIQNLWVIWQLVKFIWFIQLKDQYIQQVSSYISLRWLILDYPLSYILCAQPSHLNKFNFDTFAIGFTHFDFTICLDSKLLFSYFWARSPGNLQLASIGSQLMREFTYN